MAQGWVVPKGGSSSLIRRGEGVGGEEICKGWTGKRRRRGAVIEMNTNKIFKKKNNLLGET